MRRWFFTCFSIIGYRRGNARKCICGNISYILWKYIFVFYRNIFHILLKYTLNFMEMYLSHKISNGVAFPYDITRRGIFLCEVSCGVAFPYKKYNIKRGGTFIFIASNLKHAHVHTYSHLQLYWTHSKQNTSYICLYLNLNGTLEISINPNISFYCNHFKRGLGAHTYNSTEATPIAFNLHCNIL